MINFLTLVDDMQKMSTSKKLRKKRRISLTPQTDLWVVIPDEIWNLIFTYFEWKMAAKIMVVCKRFCSIILNFTVPEDLRYLINNMDRKLKQGILHRFYVVDDCFGCIMSKKDSVKQFPRKKCGKCNRMKCMCKYSSRCWKCNKPDRCEDCEITYKRNNRSVIKCRIHDCNEWICSRCAIDKRNSEYTIYGNICINHRKIYCKF